MQNHNLKIKIKKYTKTHLIVILILALLAPLFILHNSSFNSPHAQAAWYNSDASWQYRQKFTVTSGSALTDYQTVLDEGEVARWKMDEGSGTNVSDASGNANNGTITNTAWTASGKYGSALSFSGGNSEKVTIPDSGTINPVAPFTISIWIKYSSTSNLVIFEKNGNSGFSLQCGASSAGKLSLWVGDVWSGPETVNTYNDNNWHHVVAVISGTGAGNGKMYVDGIEDSTGNDPATPSYGTSTPVYIGSRNGSYIFNGLIDETRIFNRALSTTEITYLNTNNASPKLQQIYANSLETGADLRFTTSDQTTNIPYWIENYTATGQNAKIWLKVPTVANGTTDIYAYYGNAGASAATSGANTFDFFDDFDGSSLDASKWETGGYGGYPGLSTEVSGGILREYSSGTWKILRAKITYDPASTVTMEGKVKHASASQSHSFGLAENSNVNNSRLNLQNYIGAGNWVAQKIVSNSTTYSSSLASIAYGNWYVLKIDKKSSTNMIATVGDATGKYINSYDSTNANWSGVTWTWVDWQYENVSIYYDWIRVRQYTATQPTVAINGSYDSSDNAAPANPTTITAKSSSGGTVLNASNIYNYTQPYFEWNAAVDTGVPQTSGVAGYYSYFGTSCGGGGADPTSTRGLLSEVGGTGIHYSADLNTTIPSALSSPGTYCLRMKTKDNFGNIQGTTWEAFSYQFDNVVPNAPSYVAVSPSGYTATDSYSFSWPVATDGTSTPQAGLAGYQYKRGTGSGDSWSATQSGTSVSALHKYQDGANIFYVRSIDNADNTSLEVQTTYYYSANAPTKPTSLTAVPTILDSNAFAFSWVAPVHSNNIVDYAYSINQYPDINNINWTGSNSTSLAEGPYATVQGINTLYLLAKDESGVYSFESSSVASVEFVCETSAPPTPTSVSVHDSSDRTTNRWMLTLDWLAGPGQNEASFDHYTIERSLNGTDFTPISTTQSRAYIDSNGLSQDTLYFYRIKSVDNATRESVASSIVSSTPTGRYTAPPTILTDPAAQDIKTNQVRITWVSSRPCLSFVSYGESNSNLSETKGDMQTVSDHSITISGLKSSTKYYFKVQSLDEFRDYDASLAYSTVYDFTTNPAAQLSNVAISNITLTTADISWESSVATSANVLYGTSINYGSTYSQDSSSYVAHHSIKLTNLSHSSTYHFKIVGLDQDGTPISSDDYTFETQKMPKISNITYATDYSGAAPVMVVSWKTNVPTTSTISYFPKDGSVSDANEEAKSALTTDHTLTLSDLADSTEYKFTLSGRDQFGNLVESDENIMVTDTDKRPAVITNLTVENNTIGSGDSSKSQAVIYWQTDEPATSQVEYDEFLSAPGEYRKKSFDDQTLKKEHLVIITDLDPMKLYHLRAVSKDKAENTSYSEDRVIISGEAMTSPLSRIINMFNNLFGWVTKYFK